MRSLAGTFLLLLLLATPALAQRLDSVQPPSPDAVVQLQADRLVREEDGTLRAIGNVRVTIDTIHIAADEAYTDPEGHNIILEGRVTLADGRVVVRARRVNFDRLARSGILDDVAFFQKKEPVDPLQALDAPDPLTLRRLGENEVELRAEGLVRLADGSYVAIGPTATTCDCDGIPDWKVSASSATLGTDQRLSLSWPVFYARDVPIFALPWFSLPLSNERQSGLLQPSFSILGRRGPSYEQPLYLVLGHSYDLTLSLGYFFGHGRPVLDENGEPVIFEGKVLEQEVAFLGPRATAEFRYAPRWGTSGKAYAAYGYDLSKRPTAENLEVLRLTRPDEKDQSPHRFALQLDHADEWGWGIEDRIALNLVSDREYIPDFTDDIILRGEQVLRSTAWFGVRQGPSLAVVEGVYLQDLRPPFGPNEAPPPGFSESVRLFGRGQRDTLQRLPAVAFDVARLQLPGGAGLRLHLGAAHFGTFSATGFRDVGIDGLGPGDARYPGPDEGEGDGRFEAGEIPSVQRLAIRPTLTWPILFGRYLSVTPYAAWRQQIYDYGPSSVGTGHAAWAYAGAAAHTELARTYAGGTRHAFVPRLEVRHLHPVHTKDAPDSLRIYDNLDLRPLRAVTQGRVSLASLWDLPGGGAASLEIGQEATLSPEAEISEAYAEAGIGIGPFEGRGLFSWDPSRDEITEVVARLRVTSLRGDSLRVSYRHLGSHSTRLRAGPDELFADDFTESIPLAFPFALEQIGAGATWVVIPELSLSYDFLFLPPLPDAKLLEQRATISFLSACQCWGAAIHAAKRRDENVSLWLSVNLGEF